ncbi:SGNH/GDSL hydrolase family protein [Sphingomonas sp. BK235]|uniref:SGNH/GDSL hydrolase family protein n=1 Tax=Sphingomonas sp. BK235 TaxID=2512131 RepID=UPI0010F3BFED|nr:SGNH/GDSL hydrolase family protein [Sphingomonas sp. BK235]TCP36561.1 GDSL-like lipase/acylhydrolase family protein [Sphingomonas sp. BK235]
MPSTTAAGSAIAISTGTPASFDAAGFAALAYTEIGGIDKIGVIGPTFGKVEFQPLKGPKDKLKGAPDYGTLTPSMAYDEADAGQAVLRVAAEDETQRLYPVRVTYPNGSIRYARARVFAATENVDGAESVLMTNASIEICTKPVKVSASGTPAPAFTTPPSISPSSGAVGTTFTASNGAASNSTALTRRWLLNGSSIGTGATVTPNAAGTLVLEVTATGPGGSTVANSASVTVGSTSTKFTRTAAAAATSNPETAPLATGATQEMNTTTDSTLSQKIAGSALLPIITATGGSPYLRTANNGVYFPSGAYAGSSSNGNLGTAAPSYATDAASWGYEVEIYTNAPRIEFAQNAGVTTHGARVQVDGRYVDKAGKFYPSGSASFTVVDFAGVSAWRRIKLEGEFNTCLFSINVAPGFEVQKVAAPADRVLVAGFGNSLLEGVQSMPTGQTIGAIIQQAGFFKTAARLAGWTDARQAGVGGTDFFRVGTNGRLPIMHQIPRFLVVNPDIAGADVDLVVFSTETNDISVWLGSGGWTVTSPDGNTTFTSSTAQDTATYQALVAYTLGRIRATFPNAIIMVPGVWPQNLGITSGIIAMENAIKAAVAQLGDAKAIFVPVSTSTSPWLTDANKATYLGQDNLHPTPLGHAELLGGKVNAAYRAIIAGQQPA